MKLSLSFGKADDCEYLQAVSFCLFVSKSRLFCSGLDMEVNKAGKLISFANMQIRFEKLVLSERVDKSVAIVVCRFYKMFNVVLRIIASKLPRKDIYSFWYFFLVFFMGSSKNSGQLQVKFFFYSKHFFDGSSLIVG